MNSNAELAQYAEVDLPERPMLVPWVDPIELSTGWLQFRSGTSFTNLRHPILAAAFAAARPMLDGRHTVAEITANPPDGIFPTTIVFLLKALRKLGLLVDASPPGDSGSSRPDQVPFLSQFGPDPTRTATDVANGRVLIVGCVLSEDVGRLIQTAGTLLIKAPNDRAFTALCEDARPDIVVHMSAGIGLDYGPDSAAVNDAAVARGLPVLYVHVQWRSALVGPLVIPGETACLRCLQARLRANAHRSVGSEDRGNPLPADSDPVLPPPFRAHVAGVVAGEIHRILGRYAPPATIGNLHQVDLTSLATRRHAVLRVPGCPTCHLASTRT